MAGVNDGDVPWESLEGHPKDRRNITDKTRDLSLNENSEISEVDNNSQKQSFGGFSVPKAFGGTFGTAINMRIGPHDGNNRLGGIDGGSYSNGSRGVVSKSASKDAFRTNASSAERTPVSSKPPNFTGNNERWINRRTRPEGEGDSKLEQENLAARNSSRTSRLSPSLPENRSCSINAGSIRIQQPFQSDNLPETLTLSLEEREKNFWKQAAYRSSPFVPVQTATPPTNKNIFDGFLPPTSGRPLYGRGFCTDGQTGRGHDIVPTSPPEHVPVVEVDKCKSRDGGDGGTHILPKDEYEKPMSNEEISLLNKILHKKLENLQNGNLEISQARSDPNSPLYSVTSFQSLRLKDELLKALDKMSFYMPSKIQEAALPLLLVEPPMNLIAQAQSGTGKTATFVLTMLSRVVSSNKWPQCLCLAPTYELAMQIGEVVQKMSEFLPEIKIRYAVKGERMSRGEKIEEQIIIGTPGKMLDWVTKLKVIDPSKIICLVLDEADVMISQQGHQDQSIRLHNELERAGAKYQSLLFSATYDETVRTFADSIIKDAVNIT
uniref:RNA helicase n=1 Tax=Setaria digitata TaxID=48799 RepID=A0A915PGS3_9BILA